jgi:hypothetical protein
MLVSYISSIILYAGKFYLVDAGYPNRPEFIAPFRGVRYHLSEYDVDRLPTNAVENFNYRHSQLRSAIEQSFGIVKHRFTILKGQMPFPFDTQVKIVIACCLLHNFIRMTDKDDVPEDTELEESTPSEPYSSTLPTTRQEDERKTMADQMRHNIATSMWDGRL